MICKKKINVEKRIRSLESMKRSASTPEMKEKLQVEIEEMRLRSSIWSRTCDRVERMLTEKKQVRLWGGWSMKVGMIEILYLACVLTYLVSGSVLLWALGMQATGENMVLASAIACTISFFGALFVQFCSEY